MRAIVCLLILLPFVTPELCYAQGAGSAAETYVAQGFRISTQIYDISRMPAAGDGQVISSSLTLCHNGRVYDYVSMADELVIYDPVEHQFLVLNPSRGLSTVITFDEIRHHMETRVRRTEEYLQEMTESGDPKAATEAASIRFQLQPEFRETFDPMKGTLILTSSEMTYRVETRKWPDAVQVDRYLTYRDWAAKLNSVLHPENLFPEPRLAVNDALRRQKQRMPVTVELDRRPNASSRLRAEHQITVGLADDDRTRIARWEELQKSGRLEKVPLRRYQQANLISKSR